MGRLDLIDKHRHEDELYEQRKSSRRRFRRGGRRSKDKNHGPEFGLDLVETSKTLQRITA